MGTSQIRRRGLARRPACRPAARGLAFVRGGLAAGLLAVLAFPPTLCLADGPADLTAKVPVLLTPAENGTVPAWGSPRSERPVSPFAAPAILLPAADRAGGAAEPVAGFSSPSNAGADYLRAPVLRL